jgi:hypothetical protein
MEDCALSAMGFEGRAGFQYNYDLPDGPVWPRAKGCLN